MLEKGLPIARALRVKWMSWCSVKRAGLHRKTKQPKRIDLEIRYWLHRLIGLLNKQIGQVPRKGIFACVSGVSNIFVLSSSPTDG